PALGALDAAVGREGGRADRAHLVLGVDRPAALGATGDGGPRLDTDVSGIRSNRLSEVVELGLPFLRWRPFLRSWARLLAGFLPKRRDPLFGSRGDERLGARFPDEDLLTEFLPQAIELLVHLPLLPTVTVEVGF